MTEVPYLLLSSIKIPFPVGPVFEGNSDDRNDNFRVPRLKHGNQLRKTFNQLVNLDIPRPISRQKENSYPFIDCKCLRLQKKKNPTHRNGQIGYVAIPEIFFHSEKNKRVSEEVSSRKTFKCQNECFTRTIFYDTERGYSKGTQFGYDEFKKLPNSDDLYSLDFARHDANSSISYNTIPCIKPLTEEELEEINKKYYEME